MNSFFILQSVRHNVCHQIDQSTSDHVWNYADAAVHEAVYSSSLRLIRFPIQNTLDVMRGRTVFEKLYNAKIHNEFP